MSRCFLEEANRMTQAYSLRARIRRVFISRYGEHWPASCFCAAWTAQMRCMKACILRGYQGAIYYTAKEPCKAKDWLYMGVWLVLFAVLKVTG